MLSLVKKVVVVYVEDVHELILVPRNHLFMSLIITHYFLTLILTFFLANIVHH